MSISFSKYCGITIRRDLNALSRYCCKSCKTKLDRLVKNINQFRYDYERSLSEQCQSKRLHHASPIKSPARSSPPRKIHRSASPAHKSSAERRLFSSPPKEMNQVWLSFALLIVTIVLFLTKHQNCNEMNTFFSLCRLRPLKNH